MLRIVTKTITNTLHSKISINTLFCSFPLTFTLHNNFGTIIKSQKVSKPIINRHKKIAHALSININVNTSNNNSNTSEVTD